MPAGRSWGEDSDAPGPVAAGCDERGETATGTPDQGMEHADRHRCARRTAIHAAGCSRTAGARRPAMAAHGATAFAGTPPAAMPGPGCWRASRCSALASTQRRQAGTDASVAACEACRCGSASIFSPSSPRPTVVAAMRWRMPVRRVAGAYSPVLEMHDERRGPAGRVPRGAAPSLNALQQIRCPGPGQSVFRYSTSSPFCLAVSCSFCLVL